MSNTLDPDQDHQNPDLLSADNKSHPRKERSFRVMVLEEECFEPTIYCSKKRIDPCSRYRLSFFIIGVQSTERNLKGFFLKMISHFRNAPYYMPAKSLAKVK